MNLHEFNGAWIDDYSKDERAKYEPIHGDNRDKWPDKVEYSPIVVDLDDIARINPSLRFRDVTWMHFRKGPSAGINLPYQELMVIIRANHAVISHIGKQDVDNLLNNLIK